jgi:ABC-2 type transport system permease protein/oleandomycin transport system permease protein
MTYAVSDTWVMAKRNLLIWKRVPAYLVFTIVQPTIFTLLFRYVFGGAIPVDMPGGYVNYLLPGIIGQTAAFASFATAISLAVEAQKGVVDRLRAMPMARSAYLGGRLLADVVRMAITILVIVGVGYLVGFRFRNGVLPAIGMVLLAIALGFAVCLVSATIGLWLKNEESTQAFGMIWLFPLSFVSSAFVPVQTMPGWLQAFANNQPITHVVNALRALALGTPMRDDLWLSLVWLAAIAAVFTPLAVRTYQRVS